MEFHLGPTHISWDNLPISKSLITSANTLPFHRAFTASKDYDIDILWGNNFFSLPLKEPNCFPETWEFFFRNLEYFSKEDEREWIK
jgi:hypothetical protein